MPASHLLRTTLLAVFVLLAVGVAPASAEMAFERKWGPTPDGTFRSLQSVATDPATNTVYVADGTGRIQAFDASGAFLRKWGSRGTAAGQIIDTITDMTTDADGNVYVVDSNRVQKFTSSGTWLRTFGAGFGTGPGQMSSPKSVAVDAGGNVYVADEGNHRIQKFDAQGNLLLAWGSQGTGPGQFRLAYGLAVAPNGDVYVADLQNARVQRFTSEGVYLSEFATGPNTSPRSIAIDAAGLLYVVAKTSEIDVYTAGGLDLGSIGSPGPGDGQFRFPADDVAVTGGHAYTSNPDDRVQKFTTTGTYVTKIGRPAGTANGEFVNVEPIAASPAGPVYVGDAVGRVQEFAADGSFVRAWGSPGTGPGQFNTVAALAVAPSGDVYVAETARVQRFSATGTHLGGWGTPGNAVGQFATIEAIAVHPSGSVFTLERTTNRVQKFSPSGEFITSFTWTPGTGPSEFPRPTGLAFGSDGNLYVAHGGNRRKIDRFSPDGAFLGQITSANSEAIAADAHGHLFTLDGNGGLQRLDLHGLTYESLGGFNARGEGDGEFMFPRGIAAAGRSLFIADTQNWRVQKFTENDSDAPETALTSGPADRVNTAGAGFAYTSTDNRSTFRCRMDGGAWEICNSAGIAFSGGTKTFANLTEAEHTFEVKAVDEAGNEDPTPVVRTFTIDRTAPETTIDAGPSGLTNASPVQFALGSTELESSFECRLDSAAGSGSWAPCATSPNYASLADGPYTLHARATDVAKNTDGSPATRSFTVDRTASVTVMDGGPSGSTKADPISFTFSSPDPDAAFDCRLDVGTTPGAWSTCTSGQEYSGLLDGPYTFHVRARDAAGNVDPTPPSRSFTVDRTAPETSIGSGPDGPTNAAPVVFAFSATGGATGYDCRLDAGATEGTWEPCTSTRSFAGLAEGAYTFNVRAKDAAGNVDASPATRSFTVDRTAPETAIDSGPSGPTNAEPLTFELSSTGGATLVECRLTRDGVAGTWETCPSTKTFTTLSEASYVLEARARDAAGNADATPAARSFVVDRTAPETTIDSGPTGPTNAEPAVFAFSATGGDTGFECRLDAGATPGAWQPCTSTRSLAALADGAYTFNVRAKDAAGNADASPATRSFVVDRTAPETAIASGPTGATNADPISFGLTSGDATATFECRLDRNALVGEWGACATPRTLAGLTDASYVLNVRAVDTAGNRDATPATRSFTVDRAAPDTALTSGPSGATNADLIAFAFNTTDGAATFECRLDTETTPGAWLPCSSTRSFSGLDDGVYTFNVRAKDALGNADASPATRSFTLDRTAPETTLSSGPSGTVTSTSATFTFSSPENGSRFECRLDGGPWAPCASSVVYDGLSVATHVVDVRALDALGNADATPASRTWTVASPPSSGSSGPSGTSGPGPSGSSGQSGSQASNGAEQSGHDVGLTLAGTKVRGGRAVRLAIACGEACPALSASASVKIAGTRKALPVGGARVAAGERAVTLKLSKRTREAVKRALARKRRVTLTVRVMGLQPGGGVLWTKRQTLTLKRL